ncbi:ATP-binding protein [Lutimonas vermicola]|uniref:ATP-binding protein n=1 Tax=Lutimonas vermicola TaxID=414288 RepID=A0ABU9L5A9_9FLAO
MKYSQVTFGKDLYDLVYNDIVQFFDVEKEETLNLEFKSYPVAGNHNDKEKAVLKAICGLLNSEGGIVIWGAPTEVTNAHGNTTAEGALTPFTAVLDRDRLINKISNLIIPLPIDIRVQKLNAPNGNSIFVIEVEKSNQKPHQYGNNYYIRLDGQTRIAPHYLIEAMMKSIDYPIIKGHLRLKNVEFIAEGLNLSFRKIILNTSKFNNEVNAFFKIVTPNTILFGEDSFDGEFSNDFDIFNHGRPIAGDFNVLVSSNYLVTNNNNFDIALSFGGQKSPSKISIYQYTFAGDIAIGPVADESMFLNNKEENTLPTISLSDDEFIDNFLNDNEH